MQCHKYSLWVTILCIASSHISAAGIESSPSIDETTVKIDTTENATNIQSVGYDLISPESNLNITETDSETSKTEDKVSLKSSEKREIENITFNDIKPLLLFPILPFLFPPKDDESLTSSGKDEFSLDKNETSKIEDNPPKGKPFIFFDFAFNIRRIPINNMSDSANDSKIIKVEKLSDNSNSNPDELDAMKNRRRRNTKMETPAFFDDTPLFPESELDEFLPKPDFFCPDLPFHHKPSKKRSRRKRNQKKTELKNDFKSFLDAFDEAFMRTKREFEWADPILNFLRGSEQPFEDEKKESTNDLFGPVTEIRKEPTVKWRIQRNIKRLNDRKDGLAKDPLSPTIILDKVVKIGEFRMHDDSKLKKNRDVADAGKSNEQIGQDEKTKVNDEAIPKSIFEFLDERKGRKGSFPKTSKEEAPSNDQKRSISASLSKIMPKLKEKNSKSDFEFQKDNTTVNIHELMKMLDLLKDKMESNLENLAHKSAGKSKTESTTERVTPKINFEETLKKNLTNLLEQFLVINKNLDDAKLLEKLEVNERDNARVLDLTEKETVQTANSLEGSVRGPAILRQKKDAEFADEYVTSTKKERQVADFKNLFLNVTLPTILVFAVVLLVCFYSLQVKGKICTKLFRPRQVLIVNDEATMQLKNPTVKKVQPI